MIPLIKVKEIIIRHSALEKELASGNIEPKLFAKKSKEYSNLESIISIAKAYVNFEKEIRDYIKDNCPEHFDTLFGPPPKVVEKDNETVEEYKAPRGGSRGGNARVQFPKTSYKILWG